MHRFYIYPTDERLKLRCRHRMHASFYEIIELDSNIVHSYLSFGLFSIYNTNKPAVQFLCGWCYCTVKPTRKHAQCERKNRVRKHSTERVATGNDALKSLPKQWLDQKALCENAFSRKTKQPLLPSQSFRARGLFHCEVGFSDQLFGRCCTGRARIFRSSADVASTAARPPWKNFSSERCLWKRPDVCGWSDACTPYNCRRFV